MSPYSLFAPGGIVDALKGVGQSMGDAFKSYGEISAQRDQAQLARERLAMQQRQQEQEAQYQNAHLAFLQQQEQARERQEAARLGISIQELQQRKIAEQNRIKLEQQGLGLREREVASREAAAAEAARTREKQANINAIRAQMTPLYAQYKDYQKRYDEIAKQRAMFAMMSDSPEKQRMLMGLDQQQQELSGRMRNIHGMLGPASQKLAELGDYSFADVSAPEKDEVGLWNVSPDAQDEISPEERKKASESFMRASGKTKNVQQMFERQRGAPGSMSESDIERVRKMQQIMQATPGFGG